MTLTGCIILHRGSVPRHAKSVRRLHELRHGERVFIKLSQGNYIPGRASCPPDEAPLVETEDSGYFLAQEDNRVVVQSGFSMGALRALSEMLGE